MGTEAWESGNAVLVRTKGASQPCSHPDPAAPGEAAAPASQPGTAELPRALLGGHQSAPRWLTTQPWPRVQRSPGMGRGRGTALTQRPGMMRAWDQR